MDNRLLLERRISEAIIEKLAPTREFLESHYDWYLYRRMRYELALRWQQDFHDIRTVFRQIYLEQIYELIMIASEYEPWDTEDDEVYLPDYSDVLENDEFIFAHAENEFIGLAILISIEYVDWDAISTECLPYLFSPDWLGGFTSCAEAVEVCDQDYDRAKELAWSE